MAQFILLFVNKKIKNKRILALYGLGGTEAWLGVYRGSGLGINGSPYLKRATLLGFWVHAISWYVLNTKELGFSSVIYVPETPICCQVLL